MRLILSNKPSLLNKKIIHFFNLNLLNLNKASIVFDFEVAHPDDAEKYKKMGIKNYPVLLPKGSPHVTGVDAIIAFLKKKVESHNKKILNKTDQDRLDEHWNSTLNIKLDAEGKHKPEDEEDNDDLSSNLQHKIQTAFEERNKSIETSSQSRDEKSRASRSTRSNNLEDDSPASTLKNMSSRGQSSIDDDLMANFFENQEETKM